MRGRGFRKLRIAVAAGVAGSTILPAAGDRVNAAGSENVPFTVVNTEANFNRIDTDEFTAQKGLAIWDVASVAGPFGANAYGIADATRAKSNCVQTSNASIAFCSSSADTLAFDGALQVSVHGALYQAPGGIVQREGDSYAAAPVKLSGLKTDVRYDFLGVDTDGRGLVRMLVTLKNTGSKPLKRNVMIGSRLAGGALTTVDFTSTGDTTLTSADSWFVANPNQSNTATVMIARGDAGNDMVSASPEGDGDAIDLHAMKVGAGKTVRLLYYAMITGSPGPNASTFEDGVELFENDHLAGLSLTERKQIKNWTGLVP
jgi:hypothetical protein